jgi:hypothetical protein
MTCELKPLVNFGVHQVTFSDITDPSIMGMGKIIDNVTPDNNQEMIDLTGGSSAYPWASAPGLATGEIALVLKQYDKTIIKFLNANLSDESNIEESASGDSAGFVSAITNVVGTSMVDATTGIASLAVDSATVSNLAYGDYVAKAVSATTIDLYLNTDVSGKAPYIDENLKITSTPITIPGSSATVISNGIEFTGGSGSIALTTGDVATFSVRPINTYNLINYIGKAGSAPKEFRVDIFSENIDGRIRQATYPRVIAAAGGNLKFLTKEFSMIETTLKILQPCEVDYVGKETYLNK